MFIFKKHLSRRTVLKGAGVTLALPFLDAMVPAATALAQTAANPRLRAGFFYIPHGAVQFDTKFGPDGRSLDAERRGRQLQVERDHAAAGAVQEIRVDHRQSRERGQRRIGAHRNPGTWLNCSTPTHDHRSDHRQADRPGDVAAVSGGFRGNHDPAGGRQRHGHGDHAVVSRHHPAADGVQPEEGLQQVVWRDHAEGTRPERPRVRQPARPDSGPHEDVPERTGRRRSRRLRSVSGKRS